MGSIEGHSETETLRALLDEAVHLLDEHDERHWSEALRKHLVRVDDRDEGAVSAVLGMYGGMGSFSDLVIHPVNGHRIATEEVGQVNDRLSALRSAIWTESVSLRSGQATGEPRPVSGAGQRAGVAGSRVAGGHRAATRSALDAARRRADSGASGRRLVGHPASQGICDTARVKLRIEIWSRDVTGCPDCGGERVVYTGCRLP